MARNPARMRSRLRAYSASIAPTESIGPRAASSAAYCVIEVVFDVDWLCSLVTAAINGCGASKYPMRQPVIANVFENDPTIIRRSRPPGKLATVKGFALPYVKCE